MKTIEWVFFFPLPKKIAIILPIKKKGKRKKKESFNFSIGYTFK